MGLETPTYINDLNALWPLGSDEKQEGDNHLRAIKSVLKATLPNMGGVLARTQSKSAGYTAATTDNSSLFLCTAGLTLAFTAAATLGNGWHCAVYAQGGVVVLDPNASELVNAASTLSIPQGDFAIIWCDGTAFHAAVATNADLTATIAATLRTGVHSIWVPAGAMTPQFTNGPSVGIVELATNDVMLQTLDFDAVTAEFAQFEIRMPKSWDEGTLTFEAVWSHPATTTNFGVVWELAAKFAANDAAMDVAFGTAQTTADTGGTTDDLYQSPLSSAITPGGSSAVEALVQFRVGRTTANGSDTMAVDARLHGVLVQYTLSGGNDA